MWEVGGARNGGGKNGDNCNRTTIKNLKKLKIKIKKKTCQGVN